ncbi:MAG: PqqD family protein [Ruminococcus sp.]|nr:PqqD family protein [Ruminococcus sp.]MBR2303504.1 PqqD family protein [Ruminococcus sp.]
MKLKKEFVIHEADGRFLLVATGKAKFSGIVEGNEMFGKTLKLMQKDMTEAEIVKKIRDEYEAPDGVVEADVHRAVTELRKIGAIDG